VENNFQRVAIVNRGEAAMRFIHAAREFNQEHGTSLRTIGLFTEPDRHAMFVREADEAPLTSSTQTRNNPRAVMLTPASCKRPWRKPGRTLCGLGGDL
jgi:biotin carboxylase